MTALVAPEALTGFPGAPFPPKVVDAAGAQVRDQCGWHIAPQITETLTVEGDGAATLLLPSLRVIAVTEVRDVTGADPKILDGWRPSPSGVLYRQTRWPVGPIEVDLTHGYDACPDGLLPIIAERAQTFGKDASVRQESLGSRSVSYGQMEGTSSTSVLARYTIPTSP